MNFPHRTTRRLLRTLAVLNALLVVLPASGQPAPTPRAQPGDAVKEQAAGKSAVEKAATGKDAEPETAPIGKRKRKEIKREKQREAMLKRIELNAKGELSSKPALPP